MLRRFTDHPEVMDRLTGLVIHRKLNTYHPNNLPEGIHIMAFEVTYVAVLHTTTTGREVITRVREAQAEAYAESLKAEPFVVSKSVRVLPILPANKQRLAALAG